MPISLRIPLRASRVIQAVLLLMALALAAAPAALAAPLRVGIEDERLMFAAPGVAAGAVADWKAEGVTTVRITAHWGDVAPAGSGAKAPQGFDAANPNDPRYRWAELDTAVGLARGAGLDVILSVSGPGPLWTSRMPRYGHPSWYPDPRAFGAFARAVAARYGSQVDRYLIWNEPNLMPFLMPQNSCVRHGVCTPVSPHTYRDLVNAAVPAIHTTDPGSQVFFGELAPTGLPAVSRGARMSPMPFLRALACVDARLRPIRSGPCRHFQPIHADGFSYHPHPGKTPPDGHASSAQDAKFGDLPRLFRLVNSLTSRGRFRSSQGGRFPVYLTEFGYQTNPPDPLNGIPIALQSRYLQQASYLAWNWSQIKELTFYQWDDEPVSGIRGWQSGLHYLNGSPKPALSTFAAPFVVDQPPHKARATLWGQVRPAHAPLVTLQVRPRGARVWTDLLTAATAADGSWQRKLAISPGASYRYRWTPAATLADPAPLPRFSGAVAMAGRQSSELRAAAAIAG